MLDVIRGRTPGLRSAVPSRSAAHLRVDLRAVDVVRRLTGETPWYRCGIRRVRADHWVGTCARLGELERRTRPAPWERISPRVGSRENRLPTPSGSSFASPWGIPARSGSASSGGPERGSSKHVPAVDRCDRPAVAEGLTEVGYAGSGDVFIAYTTIGAGPLDLVVADGFLTHLSIMWEEPTYSSVDRAAVGCSPAYFVSTSGAWGCLIALQVWHARGPYGRCASRDGRRAGLPGRRSWALRREARSR